MRIHKTALTGKSHSRAAGPYQEAGEWFAACGDGKVLRLLEVHKEQ
jgi:hypothetical protein